MGEKNITIDERIKQIKERLDTIISDGKLKFEPSDSEIEEIFNFNGSQLGRLPVQKIAEYSFMIARYGVYLQKEINKEKALVNWAKRWMDYIVLPVMSNYRHGYMSADEVKMKAIQDNDVADRLYKFISDKEVDITVLADLAFDIKKMADTLSELSKTKRYNNG